MLRSRLGNLFRWSNNSELSRLDFLRVKLTKLEQLDCEGCENLSDKAFKFLLENKKEADNCQRKGCHLKKDETKHNGSDCHACIDSSNSIEELNYHKDRVQKNQRSEITTPTTTLASLKYINLSGCWSITDNGLE